MEDNSSVLADLDTQGIMKYIPHRYPMLMIDRMEEIVRGESAVGIKNISFSEPCFQGHFPGSPIFPGVLIIEAMAQTAATLVNYSIEKPGRVENTIIYFMSVEEAKFRKPVLPGDVLKLKVFKIKNRGAIWKFKGEAWVGNELTDEATFTAMMADRS